MREVIQIFSSAGAVDTKKTGANYATLLYFSTQQ